MLIFFPVGGRGSQEPWRPMQVALKPQGSLIGSSHLYTWEKQHNTKHNGCTQDLNHQSPLLQPDHQASNKTVQKDNPWHNKIMWASLHLLVIIGVAVECSRISTEDVLDFPIRQSSALRSADGHNSNRARIYPVWDGLAVCAEPVNDSIFIKILHVSESDLVVSSEETHKVVAASFIVIPLFGNLKITFKQNVKLLGWLLLYFRSWCTVLFP